MKSLKENYEFKRAYSRGKSFVSSCVVTYCVKRKYGGIRVGIKTGKKIGCAVERNRSRRLIRAAFRELEPSLSGSWDIVFVARVRTANEKMQTVREQIREHLGRAGVLL